MFYDAVACQGIIWPEYEIAVVWASETIIAQRWQSWHSVIQSNISFLMLGEQHMNMIKQTSQ